MDSKFLVWDHVFLHPPHENDHGLGVNVDAGGELFRAKLELHCKIEQDPELARARLESMTSSSNKQVSCGAAGDRLHAARTVSQGVPAVINGN